MTVKSLWIKAPPKSFDCNINTAIAIVCKYINANCLQLKKFREKH